MQTTPLFLLGTGRSGTTLIQRFLNSHPDIMLWGEHQGFLEDLANSYFALKEHPSMHEYAYKNVAPANCEDLLGFYKDPKKWQAWTNWFVPENVDDFYRTMLESIFNPEQVGKHKVWGFKEIRYGENPDVLRFLQCLYPQAVFLSVVREGLNVVESQLTTFHQGESKYPRIKRILQLPILMRIARSWAAMNYQLHAWASKHERCHFLRYEDFVKDYRIIRPVMDQLGLEIEPAQTEVMSMTEGRGSSFKANSDQNARWKKMGYIPSFVAELYMGKQSKKFGYPRPRALSPASLLSKLFL